jgi:Zn finger protein HypA/HybF involved in hydrogenase expression
MAAQLSPHTETQLAALVHEPYRCPKCDSKGYKVIESRKIVEGRRRRFSCSKCSFRETRYDINADVYSELLSLRQRFDTLTKVFFEAPVAQKPAKEIANTIEECPCFDCANFSSRNGCGFSLPEVGTEEAIGCTMFQKINYASIVP